MGQEGEILDYSEAFEEGGRVIVAKKFAFESEARLYAAHLNEASIPNFLSNTNTAATLPIPLLGVGSVSLHVREKDSEAAARIIAELDLQAKQTAEEESFYEADEGDIEFQRELSQNHQGHIRLILFWLVLVVSLMLVLRAFLRAAGTIDGSWDPF